MKKLYPLTATALAAVIALAGCGADDSGDMGGMDHGSMDTDSSNNASSAAEAAHHNAADVMFAQMMIPHHTQAVEMSEILLAKDDVDPEVLALAEEIKAAQAPEVELMTAWLNSWGEPVPSGDQHMMDGHAMKGMMSAEQLEQLEAATGPEAARLFLQQMIVHHRGAVAMAEQQSEEGENPEAVALAEEIVGVQQDEIETMTTLLEDV